MDMFLTGIPQTLLDILDNKEERECYKLKQLAVFPTCQLISIGINIPGDIKNNERIEKVFDLATEAFERYLVDNEIIIRHVRKKYNPTGPEFYALIDSKRDDIKKLCINFETFHQVGRLLDIDVYQRNDVGELVIIDRDFYNLPSRRCYVCEKPAKECTRAKTHSIEELRTKINEICQSLI
ncbi:citrate lyase holo-[acyl-carrier protein] synthase [Vagococcus fessus]|uniref:citrate lyase holo-[acyl-carrier protein] synthase n=1 Tax=Vagococcus fessus TaxID=120370 RepID=A0A430ACD0_9ENTE|nr:citrate lyase holo-[acyl-carrier protein] synthase [Vagococcus fessus]RSU04868.1 citrate lyase holo-[acyl-carrier protein] synthase [Vagococcus fessus]